MKIRNMFIILMCTIILSIIVSGHGNNIESNLRIIDTLKIDDGGIINYQIIHDDMNKVTCYCVGEFGYGRSSAHLQCFLDSQLQPNN